MQFLVSGQKLEIFRIQNENLTKFELREQASSKFETQRPDKWNKNKLDIQDSIKVSDLKLSSLTTILNDLESNLLEKISNELDNRVLNSN